MDNFHIDMVHEGRGSFDSIISIVVGRSPGGKATHYRAHVIEPGDAIDALGWYGEPRAPWPILVLYWHEDAGALPLPYELTAETAPTFAWDWLQQHPPPGPQPDHDGDNGHGWRVWTDSWGRPKDTTYGIVAVCPMWAMYGK